jgi:acyl-CoA synthetase (AMP-forming)/AMP-acid ligase II
MGVMVSHGSLTANLAACAAATGATRESRMVSWLPQYHDMGLVTCIVGMPARGARAFLMSPLDFLARPGRWLEAVARHRATISGAPNFAYELAAGRAAEVRGPLDLSSWERAFSGAERVRAETFERFADAFAPSGFRRSALMTG